MNKWIILGVIFVIGLVGIAAIVSLTGSSNPPPEIQTPKPSVNSPVETPPEKPTYQPKPYPSKTTPVETTPVETTPVETTPVETTPVVPPVVVPDGYTHYKSAGISGYNNKHLKNQTPDSCAKACDSETSFVCQSFDFNRDNKGCFLSVKRAPDHPLKRTYDPDVWDNYSLTSPRPVAPKEDKRLCLFRAGDKSIFRLGDLSEACKPSSGWSVTDKTNVFSSQVPGTKQYAISVASDGSHGWRGKLIEGSNAGGQGWEQKGTFWAHPSQVSNTVPVCIATDQSTWVRKHTLNSNNCAESGQQQLVFYATKA